MKLINLLLLYILVPLLIAGISVKTGDGWLLFGILVFYLGIVISRFKQWIFLPIPLIFVFWYWYTYGLAIRDYVFIFFGCFICGIILNELSKEYYKFVNKVLPEQLNNLDYNEKVDELNRRLEKFRQDHPSDKLTPEIVEQIRTEVFF